MSEEKKPGFFSRLFGRDKTADRPADESQELVETAKAIPEAKPEQPVEAAAENLKKEVKAEAPAPQKPQPEKPAPKATEEPKPVEKAKKKPATKPKPAPKPAPEPAPEEKPVEEQTLSAHEHGEELDEELSHLDAGPPETTPEWIEEHRVTKEPEEPEKKKSWFQRLASGLKRSSDQLTNNIATVFTHRRLDSQTLEELEDILIQADLGIDTAMVITSELAKDKFNKEISGEDVRQVLAQEVEKVLEPVALPLNIDAGKAPFVILMIGVNGSGKTTTIGKLAQKFNAEGKKVMLAAGDTFRAAAIEQLQIWGERTGAPVVSRPAGSDASGLAFDAVTQAKKEGSDVLIIDTAGRLQNRDELMAELEKIIRVIKKIDESAPHAVLLTLDATTGQNALNQAEIFQKRAGVTGLVMTKLDGTARGGILVAIAKKFKLPVHYIGVGEGVDDLESFAAKDFAEAIAGRE